MIIWHDEQRTRRQPWLGPDVIHTPSIGDFVIAEIPTDCTITLKMMDALIAAWVANGRRTLNEDQTWEILLRFHKQCDRMILRAEVVQSHCLKLGA